MSLNEMSVFGKTPGKSVTYRGIAIGKVLLDELTVDEIWSRMQEGAIFPQDMDLFYQRLYAVVKYQEFDEVSVPPGFSEAASKALNFVSERRRGLLIAMYFGGLTYAELARRMELSPNTVRNLVLQALHSLRSRIRSYPQN